MRTILTILILIPATPAWADMAVMDWTAEGRIAKYHKCEVTQDCIDHIEKFKGTYPDAFVTTPPAKGTFESWRVDPVAKGLLVQHDKGKLDKEIRQSIRSEADQRIAQQYSAAQQRQALARGVELLLVRLRAGSWTKAQQAEVDGLLAVLQWSRDTRQAAADAIGRLDALTDDEMAEFDPATDITWPAAP